MQEHSNQSAIDLYGANSPEVNATTNAFYAVGVGSAFVTADSILLLFLLH
jgi:hypothetical protein